MQTEVDPGVRLSNGGVVPRDDLLIGVAAIADYLGTKYSRARALCVRGSIPAWREGREWLARRSSVDRALAEREAEALAAARRRATQ